MTAEIVTPEVIAAAKRRQGAALAQRNAYLRDAAGARGITAATGIGSGVGFVGDWFLSKFEHVDPVPPDNDPYWLPDWEDSYPTFWESMAEAFSGLSMVIGYIAGGVALLALTVWLILLLVARCVRIPMVPTDPYAVWDEITEQIRRNREYVLEGLSDDVRKAITTPLDKPRKAKAVEDRQAAQSMRIVKYVTAPRNHQRRRR